MSFDWKNLVDLSEELIQRSDEASLRSGISRAYFGAFCTARNKVNARSISTSEVHRTVVWLLENSNKSKFLAAASILNQLRYQRNKADYDDSINVNKAEAEKACVRARKILQLLDT